MSFVTAETSIRVVPLARASAPDLPSVVPLNSRCSRCHLRELCLPGGMEGADIQRLDNMMFSRRRLKAGTTLYRQGERFEFIYAVRSGTFKTNLELADGREQVSGFYLGGEMMGLDGVAQGKHASSATALEDADVCAIPFTHLAELSSAYPGMQHVVGRMMSREIVREHSLMLLLGSMNAEERLAAFLLNFSLRLKARGYSPSEFHLRMSREEIGSYLGLKLETVSRTFSAFQQQGLLAVDRRHIRIADMDGLSRALEMRMH
jgi:CRP/FNR family transcriptional regulator, anaerobic regulatory protein